MLSNYINSILTYYGAKKGYLNLIFYVCKKKWDLGILSKAHLTALWFVGWWICASSFFSPRCLEPKPKKGVLPVQMVCVQGFSSGWA